ncbi:MAG: UvrD-helicase domain-containing protein [Flavobacteriaceae bacterium]
MEQNRLIHMSNPPRFKIYDASAGSGKTYTLVKEFLITALSSPAPDNYQSALAITFTNKAVQEMKTRLLEVLSQFSEKRMVTSPTELFADVAQEIGIDHHQLHFRSSQMLTHLLQYYSHFSICTIDRLTHQIVRTFSRDLGLSSSFELALDTETFLIQAVDLLIEKAGTDPQLTRVLLRFVTSKADQDKSWDVAYDLNKVAKLIYNENHHEPLRETANKTWDDFQALEKILVSNKENLSQQLIVNTQKLQERLSSFKISQASFSHGELPKQIAKVLKREWNKLPGTRLIGQIEKGTILKKSASSEDHAAIESIQPDLENWLASLSQTLPKLRLIDTFLIQLAPLSVLNALHLTLHEIQSEKNTMLLSGLNTIIANAIQDTPTPFIYERLGVRYQHYYIDEFQDTSALQWNNLSALAEHALSTEHGRLMLVGDAKQAIYRWRGGYPEQFMALSKGASPFEGVKPKTSPLPKNYRSLDNIVETNNLFFRFMAKDLKISDYRKLFLNASEQEKNNHSGGWTTLSFVEGDLVDERTPYYLEATLDRVKDALSRGYAKSDICVLVRKHKQGVAVTALLNQHDVQVVSAETLLIDQSTEVSLLLALLRLRIDNQHQAARKTVLSYFTTVNQDVFDWLSIHLEGDIYAMFEAICDTQYEFSFDTFRQKKTYSALEYAIQSFRLTQEVSAFLSGLLEEVLQHNAQQSVSDAAFLAYWDEVKEQRSVSVPENLDAVRVMTIHKAKGLAFPVVILPFADADIYGTKSPECWHPVEADQYAGFQHMLVRANTQLQATGLVGEALYYKHRSEQLLDALNVLYVAMTRPERELHILTHESEKTNSSYAGLFTAFVKENKPKKIAFNSYGFGSPTTQPNPTPKPTIQTKPSKWIGNATPAVLYRHQKPIWDQPQREAVNYGNLFHDLMAEIYVQADVDEVVQSAIFQGRIGKQDGINLKKKIQTLVNMPELSDFFEVGHRKFRERTLFAPDGTQLRPDSFVILPSGKVSILDYKTGNRQVTHEDQLHTYARCFKQMGYDTDRLLILYVGEMLKLEQIS